MLASSFSRRFGSWLVAGACAVTFALTLRPAHAQLNPPAPPTAAEQAAAATNTGIADDKTAEVLQKLQDGGLREIIAVKRNDITVHLLITSAGDTLIRNKAFDVPDETFRLPYFTDFVIGQFGDAIKYFETIVPKPGISEIYLVLDDLKAVGRGTISQAIPSSRVIQLGIPRWHSIYKGRDTYLGEITTIHEFTHVVNYSLDPNEDKLNRELTGIVFELISFTYHEGVDGLRDTYPKVSGRVTNPQEVLSAEFTSNSVLRNIAFWMFWNVMNGTYIINDKSAPLDALKKFARLYLTNPQQGAAGFDAACAGASLANDVGQPLTLKSLQGDLYANLTGTQDGQ